MCEHHQDTDVKIKDTLKNNREKLNQTVEENKDTICDYLADLINRIRGEVNVTPSDGQ